MMASEIERSMSLIQYSRGSGKFDNTPVQKSAETFESLIEAILADRQPRKGTGWISGPVGVAPDDGWHRSKQSMAKAIGKPHRCMECAQPRKFIGLDIDDGFTPEAWGDLLYHLQRYRFLAYTTHSSTPEAPRARVIVELDQAPQNRDEFMRASAAFRARISKEIGAIPLDDSADKPEQPLYLPGPDAQVFTGLDGSPACVDDLLREAPPAREKGAQAAKPLPLDDLPLEPVLARLKGILDAIPNDNEDYATWLQDVGMVLHYETRGHEHGYQLWIDWSRTSSKHDPSEMRRKWASFRLDHPNPKTIKTLQAMAGDDEEVLPYATEMQLAEQFVEETKGVMLWTHGLDWMANRGTHWERDDTLWRYSAAKRVCRATANQLDNPKIQAKICSASTANALINLARPELATPVEAWDAHPMLLNTPGGVFDLETGREVSREGLLFTQVAGVAPTTAATPTWDKFVSDVFGGDAEMVEFIQRMGGYCLTGSIREQKLFFLHGVGANGKSVFLDVLRNIGGKYSHNLPSEALMTSRSEGHPTMFASLHGKRLAISSEIEESAHWAESRIKSLTGDETLTARYMRQDFFTFAISHKHVIAGNFKPRLKGDDFAMVRRMVLIPFLRKFEGASRDNDLPQKLRAEYGGVLRWFIEGARKWARDGLAIPESVTEASKSYMAENNDMLLWLADCCKTGPGLTGTSSALYASFAEWKQGNGEHAPSVKAFSQRLERMFSKKRGAAGVVFEGLAASSSTSTGAYSRASNGW